LIFQSSDFSSSERLYTTRQHAIIVPYRDRPYHLEQFTEYMSGYLKHHFPNDSFSLWIIEQDDTDLFNRAFLTNVGLDLLDNSTECVILHDVDLAPGFFSFVPYNNCTRPTHLSSESQNQDFKTPYAEFSGAVMNLHLEHWRVINGMSNAFRGWGGEDDELFRRLLFKGLLDCNLYPPQPARPPKGSGVFLTISEQKEHHTRGKQNETAHLQNIALIMEYDAKGVDRSETDGWKFTKYNVTDHQVLRPTSGGFSAVHHIKVYQRSP
jgi:N-terminal domain of galactosyltransferase/N-terminal region of glycosyl transferase group 7